MAASKNAKKRRNKNIKKQQLAEKEGSVSPMSRQNSPDKDASLKSVSPENKTIATTIPGIDTIPDLQLSVDPILDKSNVRADAEVRDTSSVAVEGAPDAVEDSDIDDVDFHDAVQPEIPQRSVARAVDTDEAIMLEAKRQPIMAFSKPVMLVAPSTADKNETPRETKHETQVEVPEESTQDKASRQDDETFINNLTKPSKIVEPVGSAEPVETVEFAEDIDPDMYFDDEEDAVVSNVQRDDLLPPNNDSNANDELHEVEKEQPHIPLTEKPDSDNHDDLKGKGNSYKPFDISLQEPFDIPSQDGEVLTDGPTTSLPAVGMIRKVDHQDSTLKLPLMSSSNTPVPGSPEHRISQVSVDDSLKSSLQQSPNYHPEWTKNTNKNGNSSNMLESAPNLDFEPPSARNFDNEEPLSSPNASPRPYKYAQSPLPHPELERKPEPPIFGVCVVGFHHKRGPEVEYWVGPEESRSNMWPYLPFQSLPDGSHQFEENVCYFTLLYDRNKCASTSLTFLRDEEGHIQKGTSDFRNVTTLFAIACSRQVPLADLEQIGVNEEYTRSVVQKSVVVIASKPIFGPIKEKLTVVTRSFFNQRNFNDRSIIDHLYANLVQMPLWSNENDLQVGMNLQRCIHDFGIQTLIILKAMLLELKILFYSSDTDKVGTTQFALISLVPDLINHLEDCGSPLLSSYELNLQPPQSLKSSDRSSLLKYAGFPLQLFAGGGVFAPFVPLQQFEDLKQPETRYGLFGTANNLFLSTELDFDVVVNVDTNSLEIRNSEVIPLLKLSECDRAFAQDVTDAVNKAWDTEDRWQPQALGYYGGEDYIRHEFEEYLIALLGSAKQTKALLTPSSETASNSSHTEVKDPTTVLQPWNKAWCDKWMATTNNFRIFDQHADDELHHLVNTVHPGQKFLKPTGLERFFGLFKSRPPSSPGKRHSVASVVTQSGNQVPSSSPSNPQTPSLESTNKFDSEPFTPRNLGEFTPRGGI